MTSLPIIRKLKSLKNLAVYQEWTANVDTPEFKQANLIYGFNRTGKTTLSRIFASLEVGIVAPRLPVGGGFSIELSDGVIVSDKKNLGYLKNRIVVFNEDFIEDNLRWKDGTANPVFYIGKKQTELVKELEKAESEYVDLRLKRDQAKKNSEDAEKEFNKRKTEQARLIEEAINKVRKYNARSLTSDYEGKCYGEELRLSDQELKAAKTLHSQESPLPKLTQRVPHTFALETQLRETVEVLGETIGSLSIKSLQEHESMLGWAKEGLEYHEKNKLMECLLCGNIFTNDRKESLSQAINGKFDLLNRKIAALADEWTVTKERLTVVTTSLFSENDFDKNCVEEYRSLLVRLNKIVQFGSKIILACEILIKTKSSSPNSQLKGESLPSLQEAAVWDKEIADCTRGLNSLIEKHNSAFDFFRVNQDSAGEKIKNHFLADGESQYRNDEKAVEAATDLFNELETKYYALTDKIAGIKAQIREHGPAAEKMNQLLTSYLRHEQLKIEPADDGYKILRDGKPLDGSLCEGEKTAIALCYFLSTLQAEQRKINNLIVVIDDPVSSLDTRALNIAFNLIKGAVSTAAQVIMLTHNIHFMNEVKKWLKNKDGKAASLIFIEAAQKDMTSPRTSSIKKMPALIRDYESEYHYLFDRILKFKNSPNDFADYFYLIPNALRKVLDMYLAFKVPGSSGLAGKLEHSVVMDSGVPQAQLRALDRLVQVESHADNLDDFISLSSMTIEETKDAATALLALIEGTDKGHFSQMCRLCKTSPQPSAELATTENIVRQNVVGSLSEAVSDLSVDLADAQEAENKQSQNTASSNDH